MKRLLIGILLLGMCISLSGCVWFMKNNRGAWGLGKRIIEYYPDGSVKKETLESKSILDGIFGFKINTKTGD